MDRTARGLHSCLVPQPAPAGMARPLPDAGSCPTASPPSRYVPPPQAPPLGDGAGGARLPHPGAGSAVRVGLAAPGEVAGGAAHRRAAGPHQALRRGRQGEGRRRPAPRFTASAATPGSLRLLAGSSSLPRLPAACLLNAKRRNSTAGARPVAPGCAHGPPLGPPFLHRCSCWRRC